MRLIKLTIANFKNLQHMTIDFCQDTLTTVVLGRNGTGKSSLLEAIVLIFRNLDLGEPPAFKYALDYTCNNRDIHIDADPQRIDQLQTKIYVNTQLLSSEQQSQLRELHILPKYIFGYYSGLSNNLHALFEAHQERFYTEIVHGIETHDLPLIYAQPAYRQFALLSFFIEQDEQVRIFLKQYFGITDIDNAIFILGSPPWQSTDGDTRFWGARGNLQRVLDYLYEIADDPVRRTGRTTADYKSRYQRQYLYLPLKNRAAIERFYRLFDSPQAFFYALASIEMSGLLSDIRITVQVQNGNGTLTSRSLSEGEQQLLMVLGLLRLTRNEETLFLLDEPDTHLNPAWSIQYLDLIDRLVGPQPASQIIMTTHNPLIISSLDKQQVRIMERDQDTAAITATEPHESPRGMGVAAILTSDLFGLRSSLDLPTQRLIDERRELAVKDELTGTELRPDERAKLSKLNRQLKDLDFSITTHDPLYHDFVREMTKQEDPEIRTSVTLTDEQRQQQRDLTRRILRKIKEKRDRQA